MPKMPRHPLKTSVLFLPSSIGISGYSSSIFNSSLIYFNEWIYLLSLRIRGAGTGERGSRSVPSRGKRGERKIECGPEKRGNGERRGFSRERRREGCKETGSLVVVLIWKCDHGTSRDGEQIDNRVRQRGRGSRNGREGTVTRNGVERVDGKKISLNA